jgi:peptide/nickel transport system substrate-binding protein
MYTSVYPVLTQWINPKVPKYRVRPKQAVKLLAELGFTRKDPGGLPGGQ